MEDLWLAWAKRLQSIASNGLLFSSDEYDRERYREVADIANRMLSTLGSVPIGRIEDLVSDFASGYATPKVDVRGAVIRDERILLVREATDQLWTLPGGFAEVGCSPAENVEKEIWEETSLRAKAKSVYGIRHKAKHNYDPDVRDFYKIFFICEGLEGEPEPGAETMDVGFFDLEALPPLSTGRVLESDLVAAFRFMKDSQPMMEFD
ncbi:NUDIX domain-containing protein [Leptolyngbyaceae cyanobacterium CCMR0082]|uniref:NUDIX domain-containing protein n=1 Tax=Adonisia turfae CCMR0082 TaxID=2304604 RepID=A0A6M0SHN0_9CYAN|nr:NUDIX hydrolase [Adonisia turfae]NEZ68017.1 NUDIX domain-containing protein [Adonisia turfae CCMR0082]